VRITENTLGWRLRSSSGKKSGIGFTVQLLYPTPSERGVSYYCRQPFYEPYNLNQRWSNVRPALLVVSESQAAVFFENDESQVLPLDFDDTIPPGSYRCPS